MFSIGEHKLYFYEWEFTNAVNERYTVKSLIKAIRVLECFSVENPELGISEISRMLHLQKSSVYNILTTFECCGYVKQNSQSGKYRLGLKVLHLGYIVSHHMGLRDIFQPYMAEIATKHKPVTSLYQITMKCSTLKQFTLMDSKPEIFWASVRHCTAQGLERQCWHL